MEGEIPMMIPLDKPSESYPIKTQPKKEFPKVNNNGITFPHSLLHKHNIKGAPTQFSSRGNFLGLPPRPYMLAIIIFIGVIKEGQHLL
jgi:hypothetical protein